MCFVSRYNAKVWHFNAFCVSLYNSFLYNIANIDLLSHVKCFNVKYKHFHSEAKMKCFSRCSNSSWNDAPWAQQRSSCGFSGSGALSAVLHQAANQVVRDHHVQQEDEHSGIHSSRARAPPAKPPGVNRTRGRWWWRGRGGGEVTLIWAPTSGAQLARFSPWQRAMFRNPPLVFVKWGFSCFFLFFSPGFPSCLPRKQQMGVALQLQQLRGDTGGCCRRDATVAKGIVSSSLHHEVQRSETCQQVYRQEDLKLAIHYVRKVLLGFCGKKSKSVGF